MTLEEQLQQLTQRSEYTREILGRPPAWLLRWGSLLLLMWVLSLFVLSWMIRYPDVVPAPITLTTEQPPLRTVARKGGELLMLEPTLKQVDAGQVVAVIRNAVDYPRLVRARQTLAQLNNADWTHQLQHHLPLMRETFQQLGSLQSAFNQFLTEAERAQYLQETQALTRRVNALQQEVQQREKLLKQHQAQLSIIQRQVKLANKSLSRSRQLHRQQLLATADLEQQENNQLQAENDQSRQRALMAAVEVELTQLHREQLNLELEEQDVIAQHQQAVMSAYHALIGAIHQWEEDYLLKAPVAGRISWSGYWSSHQYVKPGDEVFAVVPRQGLQIIGRLALPMRNSGKVEVGQAVNIKLEGFPYTQYGVLSGTIETIAPAPAGEHYDIRVSIPQDLQTSHGQNLTFRQEMLGSADIVTEDIRLLERIFYQIWRAFG